MTIETADNSCHILSKIVGQYEILSPCWDDAAREKEKVTVFWSNTVFHFFNQFAVIIRQE